MTADLDIATPTPTLTERVARQADGLLSQQNDPAVRHGLLTTVQARRAWRGEQTLDLVVEDDDHELLTVHGQVLVSTADLALPEVQAVLDSHGLTVGTDDLVTVLTTSGDAAAVLDALRGAGATATLHHVTLLGPIVKPFGTAGPVAAEGLGSFPAYRAARA
ncbi:hypothetical protein [Cellulomonas terrae]|uniref:Uncharacterized protein n=1 Tax=Cellulomonas terrae TaxID=311234 RepID=A0A511JFA9_9CELL|nr:hypothetical protein [Cellulomonas terrae]GEL96691.1 hypothetical protein CTE05_02380 [Cellulomonas terrae]